MKVVKLTSHRTGKALFIVAENVGGFECSDRREHEKPSTTVWLNKNKFVTVSESVDEVASRLDGNWSETSVTIDGEKYPIPKRVLGLIHDISKERDHYLQQSGRLWPDTPESERIYRAYKCGYLDGYKQENRLIDPKAEAATCANEYVGTEDQRAIYDK